MTELEPDLDEGGWLGASPRTTERLSWRNDPQESHSDWKVVVRTPDEEDKVYHLHKFVLSNGARASGYFHAQFSQSTIESKTKTTVIDLSHECANCMPNVLDFVYEGTLELDTDTAVPMMEMARRLDISALGRECMEWIKARLNDKDAHFAFTALQQGIELRMEKVCAASMKVVAKNIITIDADSLMRLPIDCLLQLLQEDNLNIVEDQVFDLIVAYLASRNVSKADTQKLWLCCRFSHLSSPKKAAAMQQETFPRDIFFEDAVACMEAHDGDGDVITFSSECVRRTKKRRGTAVVTKDSILTVKGNFLTTTAGACFQVLPKASPNEVSSAQHKNPFQIPDGWKVVNKSDDDFEHIRSKVIAQYSWGTHVVHVQDGNEFVGFCCKGFFSPGAQYSRSFLVLEGNKFRFTSICGRLLIRKEV